MYDETSPLPPGLDSQPSPHWGSQPPPRSRYRALLIAGGAAGCAAIAGLATALALTASHGNQAQASSAGAPPAPAAPAAVPSQSPATVTQQPAKVIVIQPAATSGDTGIPNPYAQDIWNAGIVAPAGWVDQTGQELCSAWQAGDTVSYTDQLLLAGGIYPEHLATYDAITAQDVCPGTPGGP